MNESTGLNEGIRVGNYTLVQKLRDGGMASLYLAKRTGVHGFTRPVAIKVVHTHLSGQEEFVQMFVDEALLSSHLNHPNIVHVEEFGELPDGRCFLAMEYIDGCSLSEWTRLMRKRNDGGGDHRIVTHIGIRVAEALEAAHTALDANGVGLGVVHRDVSPGNILLSRRGHIKVVDFGIAKSSLRTEHTVQSLKGKLRYMSPDQARGAELDVRTDIYSLALVLWELLVGRPVFDAKRDLALLREVQNPTIFPPSEYVAGVPPELDAVLLKALSLSPEDRYATSREFSRALREAVPAASGVEASALAALVATIPQRNVDRATMTGTGSGSLLSNSGSLVSSSRPSDVDISPTVPTLPLGVPAEIPASVAPGFSADAGRSKRVLLTVFAVLGVGALALGGLAMTSDRVVSNEGAPDLREEQPGEDVPPGEGVVAPEVLAADPQPTRQVAVPQHVPLISPVALPPRRTWGMTTETAMSGPSRMWRPSMVVARTPAETSDRPIIDPERARVEPERARTGGTLLAGEEDEGRVPLRVTMGGGTRVQGTLLAE